MALTIPCIVFGVVAIHYDDIPRLNSPSRIMSLVDPASDFLHILIYSYCSIYYLIGLGALVMRPWTPC